MPPKDNPNPNQANGHNGPGTRETSKPDDDVPACQSCRKKKARCNRAQPCDQCTRLNVPCVYDDRRLKPGLRAGAVDQLYHRIETLENMFLGQEMLWQQVRQAIGVDVGLLEAAGDGDDQAENSLTELERRRERLKNRLLQAAESKEKGKRTSPTPRPSVVKTESTAREPKRRRLEVPLLSSSPGSDWDSDPGGLLPPDVMNELVDFYYLNIHHWIPILHVARFRERMESEEERPRIACILHAIIAVCIRFSQNERLCDEQTKARIAEKSRQKVILNSIETFSVENLQALIIVAFETIGRGRGPSSWSIIGNMVGTVEQLQLNVEEDELYQPTNAGETLIRRMLFLTPSKSWSEAEERRRVFWTVFLMDRFCSVSTGWKMSLTGAEIKRRLPCEGALWGQEREVRTPYFGISESKGTPSSSSALFASHELSTSGNQDSIGGLAYNIEATESLALVTNFFLHHAFVVDDTEKAQLWMMKFKELDLRLIQWKLYLPSKWREASVLNDDGVMDPNLILAHLTHNTAVILLHQGIAYPPAHWQSCAVKPPSASSAETCLEAASETARIGQQFLAYSPIFTNPQFSFCLFIAGRMLLAHSRYNQVSIPPVLDTLIASLLEISQRWAGPGKTTDDGEGNLASSFAKRLIEAQSNSAMHSRPSLDIRQTAYSDESKEQPRSPATGSCRSGTNAFPPRAINPSVSQNNHLEIPTPQDPFGYDPFSLAFPPLPPAFQQEFPLSAYGHGVESQAILPLGMQSYHADPLHMWPNPSVNYGNAVISPGDNLSHVSSHTPRSGH